ncbi:hypothetical protein ONZ45_g17116 [Pleurotus djamor]|nr:hypothetical protein ONZ45_g17116 [Pleurotus djamor]
MSDPFTLPTILRLPQELLDDILSLLDLHRDLINFALASKACTRLVIPRHDEYRVIRTRYILPHVWEHLARRVDLSRNIRQVHICLKADYTASDHSPTSLLKDAILPGTDAESQAQATARNMGIAISHMHYLHTFTWSWDKAVTCDSRIKLVYEYAVFDALRRLSCLSRLSLENTFLLRHPLDVDANSTYPLWSLSNLTVLRLEGSDWTKPKHIPHVLALLHRSPNLMHLDLPAEFRLPPSLRFPRLESLRMIFQFGATTEIDFHTANFIERHPSIKRLHWFPIQHDLTLDPDALPNVQLLRTSSRVIKALTRGFCVRKVERLEALSLTRDVLETTGFHRASLRRISLAHFDKLSTLRALAVTFPRITHLSLPPFAPGHIASQIIDIEAWLELLALFADLQVIRGLFLWRAVDWDKARMHEVISRLVDLCPNLQELDSVKYNQKRGVFNRIVIYRKKDGQDEVEDVRYEIEKPDYRKPFDQLEFDL